MNTVVFIPVLVPIDRLMSIRIWIALLYEADTEAPKIMHTDPLPSPHDAACFRYESTTVKAIKWVVVSLSMILAPREHILVIPNVTVIFHGKGGEPCPTLALNFPSSPLVFPSCHGSVPVVLPVHSILQCFIPCYEALNLETICCKKCLVDRLSKDHQIN